MGMLTMRHIRIRRLPIVWSIFTHSGTMVAEIALKTVKITGTGISTHKKFNFVSLFMASPSLCQQLVRKGTVIWYPLDIVTKAKKQPIQSLDSGYPGFKSFLREVRKPVPDASTPWHIQLDFHSIWTRCSGSMACVVVCRDQNDWNESLAFSSVVIVETVIDGQVNSTFWKKFLTRIFVYNNETKVSIL